MYGSPPRELPRMVVDTGEKVEQRYIKEAIESFGLDFQIEEYPEIWSALVNTGEHFKDAICMARQIDAIWDKLGLKGISRDKMMLSAILHDVGKAGSDTHSPTLRRAIKALFAPPLKPFHPFHKIGERMQPKTIRDFIRETGLQNATDIEQVLTRELNIDIDTKPILDFWRDHADWTYDLLSHNRRGMIDDDLITIASMHHILEGRNPAHVPVEDLHPGSKVFELMDKYQTLAIIDKYQAFCGRGGLSHEQAVESLRHLVENNKSLNIYARKEYLRIIEVIAASGEELGRVSVRG